MASLLIETQFPPQSDLLMGFEASDGDCLFDASSPGSACGSFDISAPSAMADPSLGIPSAYPSDPSVTLEGAFHESPPIATSPSPEISDPALVLSVNSAGSVSASSVSAVSAQANPKPEKKRRRKDSTGSRSNGTTTPTGESPQSGVTSVAAMTDDVLLRMSTEEIEALIASSRAAGTLEPDDEKRLRKCRRLIKNREYAQQSRDKKKLLTSDMQQQLEAALAESRVLKEALERTNARNAELEQENANLREALAHFQLRSVSPAAPYGVGVCLGSVGGGIVPRQMASASQQMSQTASYVRSGARVGACLLAVCVLAFVGFALVPGGSGSISAGTAAHFGRQSGAATVPTGRILMSTESSSLFRRAMARIGGSVKATVVGGGTAKTMANGGGGVPAGQTAEEYWRWQMEYLGEGGAAHLASSASDSATAAHLKGLNTAGGCDVHWLRGCVCTNASNSSVAGPASPWVDDATQSPQRCFA